MDTPEHCRAERINDIMIPALDLMKTDGAYHFGMEQALNLKELIEEHPERKDEVITRYKKGDLLGSHIQSTIDECIWENAY